jgi:hypothetical protein
VAAQFNTADATNAITITVSAFMSFWRMPSSIARPAR